MRIWRRLGGLLRDVWVGFGLADLKEGKNPT